MPSLLIAAVHNGELTSSPAQESLETVRAAAREMGWSSRLEEITSQPPLVDHSESALLKAQDERQRSAEASWDQYLGVDAVGRRIKRRLGRLRFLLAVRRPGPFPGRVARQQQIQSFVTEKHLQAAAALLSTQETFLLVLESDAVTNPQSQVRLIRLLQHLSEPNVLSGPIYVNLAGGRELSTLGVPDEWWTEREGIRTFTRPVSNTACAYLIDRELARLLLEFVDQHPTSRMLGIDWLMNGCFQSAPHITCLHAEPPIFDHGSMRGLTRSWQADL